jgi:YfiH family protein
MIFFRPPFLNPPFKDSPAAQNISCGFFTRIGGVSSGCLSSLNCSMLNGDHIDFVYENRKRVCNSLGFELNDLKTLKQEHGNLVHIVDCNTPQDSILGDALVTKDKGILLSVQTADCVPVLLYDPTNQIIAAVHSGWKGVSLNIVSKTIKTMRRIGAQEQHIYAAIGPCIKKESFEVKEDLIRYFNEEKLTDFFIFSNGSLHMDLCLMIKRQLLREGIQNQLIWESPYDTYRDEPLFFSCRRSFHRNESFGRQLSAIGLFKI